MLPIRMHMGQVPTTTVTLGLAWHPPTLPLVQWGRYYCSVRILGSRCLHREEICIDPGLKAEMQITLILQHSLYLSKRCLFIFGASNLKKKCFILREKIYVTARKQWLVNQNSRHYEKQWLANQNSRHYERQWLANQNSRHYAKQWLANQKLCNILFCSRMVYLLFSCSY